MCACLTIGLKLLATPHKRADVSTNFDIERFDVDNDKVHWPAYRDWMAKAAFLSEIIVRNKSVLLSDE